MPTLGRTLHPMATDDTREETPPAIVSLAVQVDEMRARVQQMQAELHGSSPESADYAARVKAVGTATLELLEAQSRLRAMRVAHRQQQVAELIEHDRHREQLRLWQLTGGVALTGLLVVVLAASGAVPAARLAIGVPVLFAGLLMAISMTPLVAREAGQHGIDLPKAVATAILAGLALIGALAWRPLGYACLLTLAVAAVPAAAAMRTRRRRDATPEAGGGRG